jgi:hypothetical protein
VSSGDGVEGIAQPDRVQRAGGIGRLDQRRPASGLTTSAHARRACGAAAPIDVIGLLAAWTTCVSSATTPMIPPSELAIATTAS